MRKPKTIPAARIADALKTGLPGLQRRAEHLCYQVPPANEARHAPDQSLRRCDQDTL